MRTFDHIKIGLLAGAINLAVVVLIILTEPLTRTIIYLQTYYDFGNHTNAFAFNGRLIWIALTALTLLTAFLMTKSVNKKKKIKPTNLLHFILLCWLLNISLTYINWDFYLLFKSNSIGQFKHSLLNMSVYSTLMTIPYGFILNLTISFNHRKTIKKLKKS